MDMFTLLLDGIAMKILKIDTLSLPDIFVDFHYPLEKQSPLRSTYLYSLSEMQ